MKAITLLSGGLDSTVATALAKEEYEIALALTFDYGQRAARREIESAGKFCRYLNAEHRVVELDWLRQITSTALVDATKELPGVPIEDIDRNPDERAKSVWVPGRNEVFVSIAASFAESMSCRAIIAGFNAEEARAFPDNSSGFVAATNAALRYSARADIKLTSPTLGLTKTEIAKKFLELGLDADTFWCCYDGGEKLCGRCESCARTMRAFKAVNSFGKISGRFNRLGF